MLTKKDEQKIKELIQNEVNTLALKDIKKKITAIFASLDERNKQLTRIERQLELLFTNIAEKKDIKELGTEIGKYMAIIKQYAKKQKMIEKKLEAIEDYFEPQKN